MKHYSGLILFVLFSCITVQAVNPPSHKKDIDEVLSEYMAYISADSIQSYMQGLEDFQTRFCLAGNQREVAVWIMDRFFGFGYEEVRLDSFLLKVEYPRRSGITYETWQYNVECTYPGHTYPEQVYVLGAHHDAIAQDNPFLYAPGADDNASGVAAALEVARIMMTHGYSPAATIKFVTFAAEELGLHGAFDYAGKAKGSGTDIKLMINNDMISYATRPESEWAIQVQEYPDAQWAADLAKEVIKRFTLLNAVETSRYIHATDSWAFHQNGYPAIFFIEDEFTPYYHTAEDLVASTNKHFAAEAVKISLGMLISLNGPRTATYADEPAVTGPVLFNFPNPFSERTTIAYELQQPEAVSMMLYDVHGRLVEVISAGWQQAGRHHVVWDSRGLNQGIYFCRLQTGTGIAAIRLMKYR